MAHQPSMRSRASVASDICGDLAPIHEPGYGTTGVFRTAYIDSEVRLEPLFEVRRRPARARAGVGRGLIGR